MNLNFFAKKSKSVVKKKIVDKLYYQDDRI